MVGYCWECSTKFVFTINCLSEIIYRINNLRNINWSKMCYHYPPLYLNINTLKIYFHCTACYCIVFFKLHSDWMALKLRRADALEAQRSGARADSWWCARMSLGLRALTAEGSSRWRTLRWPIIIISSISIPERRAAAASSSSSVLHAAEPRSSCRVSRRPSALLLRHPLRLKPLRVHPQLAVSRLSPPAGCCPTRGCSRCSSSKETWCSHTYHLRTVRMTGRGRPGSVCNLL